MAKEKNVKDILKKNKEGADLVPESLGDDFFEGDGMIGAALDEAMEAQESEKKKKVEDAKARQAEKRKEKNKAKKELGIRRPKQSKFSTQKHSFLGEPMSDAGIHVLLNAEYTEIYADGADFAPRIFLPRPAYGNKSNKNAFNHLITIQEKIRENRGDKPEDAPEWIIISNDTSMIMDRNLLPRLKELRSTTHAAAPYGFQTIRSNGRWYEIRENDQNHIRGCYIQGNKENTDWDFVIGADFKKSPRWRVVIGHGPFIAVRGESFMKIDFSYMAENTQYGFHHYMADISMEIHKMKLKVAQVKSSCMQFDTIREHREEDKFKHDQAVFTTKWQSNLPASIHDFT